MCAVRQREMIMHGVTESCGLRRRKRDIVLDNMRAAAAELASVVKLGN
jgi:hypothetical protein